MKKNLPVIFIYGPTAVGKTLFAENLAEKIVSAEIVNMDSMQFYKDLKVGTAKPDWQNSPIKNHFFDIVDSPSNFSVIKYREKALLLIDTIKQRGKIPIFVGGSGFYLMSLLYDQSVENEGSIDKSTNEVSWERLYQIDPKRASAIHKNDIYRINRALILWQKTGKKPSLYYPNFNPAFNFKLFFLTRNKEEMEIRVKKRTNDMMKEGFIEEVENLSIEWKLFLQKKKIIGYKEVLSFLQEDIAEDVNTFLLLKQRIERQTMQYIKKQKTFWRMIEKKLALEKNNNKNTSFNFQTLDLTLKNSNFYINQILNSL